jgi:hypothetical protein
VKTIGGICGTVVEVCKEDNTFVLETGSEKSGKSYLRFDKQAVYQSDVTVDKNEKKEPDFLFIINDQLTYHHANDFQSGDAERTFREYCQLELDYLRMEEQLEQLRTQYGEGNQTTKDQLAPNILDLENYILQLKERVDNAAKQTRRLEIEFIY